jgi:hypothetical protein
VTSDRSKSQPLAAAKIHSILVLAQPSSDTDELLEPLLRRPDLGLLRVATLDAARIALRDVAVKLVLVCPETDVAAIASILDLSEALRPGTPVLLLRARGSEVPAGSKGRTIAVLRCPVFPEVLSRTVDVALGLSPLPH